MAALVAAIHVFNRRKDVDPQIKCGDDGEVCDHPPGIVAKP
jgi:hypothetical protein